MKACNAISFLSLLIFLFLASPAAISAEPNDGQQIEYFQDELSSGGSGPEMRVLPAGSFRMGCLPADGYQCQRGLPVRTVTIPRPFAIAAYETTFAQYDRFRKATGRAGDEEAGDDGWGRDQQPAINIRWDSAEAFAAWLTQETGHVYRLPSEAEWEYAARAGTQTLWHWGKQPGSGQANCQDCGSRWSNRQPAPVGSFPANAWGLRDMHGNVAELTLDCVHFSYENAPTDGSPQRVPRERFDETMADDDGLCSERIARGGSWLSPALDAQSGMRHMVKSGEYSSTVGFRLVREM